MGLAKIEKLRKEKGITQKELSELSGVPLGTLTKIISGETSDPKLETIKAITRVLGCKLDDLGDDQAIEQMYFYESDSKEFCNNLKNLMEINNLKQADLCRMTGIPTSLMANYCSGKKTPALSNAIAIADAFEISLDELVGKSSPYNQNKGDDFVADKRFGESIQKHRNKIGLTQQELAEKLGLKNKSTLGSWEVGKSEPDAKMIAKLCKIFEIDANTLFEWSSTKPSIGNVWAVAPNEEEPRLQTPSEVNEILEDLLSLPSESLGEVRLLIEFMKFRYERDEK